jgi:hypothetical protein
MEIKRESFPMISFVKSKNLEKIGILLNVSIISYAELEKR